MEKKDIEHFKKILSNQLKELSIHAGDTVSGMTTPREKFPDPADLSKIETDRNFTLRIRDRERQLAGKIRKLFYELKTAHS